MTVAGGYISAALSILRRDLLVYTSYRARLVTQNVSVIFTLTLYYYLSKLVSTSAFPKPDDYFAFVVIGVVILLVLQSTFDIPNLLRQELLTGTFERLVVSPFGPLATTLALMCFPLLLALFTASVTIALAAAVFGVAIDWAMLPLAVPTAVLAALSFSGFSVAFAACMLRFKQVPGSAYLLAAISIVAGLYFPVSILPGWLRWTSDVQPFTPAVDLLRHLIVGLPLEQSVLGDLSRLLLFTLVGLPLGVWLLTRSINASRRRGTITEF